MRQTESSKIVCNFGRVTEDKTTPIQEADMPRIGLDIHLCWLHQRRYALQAASGLEDCVANPISFVCSEKRRFLLAHGLRALQNGRYVVGRFEEILRLLSHSLEFVDDLEKP